MLTIIFAAYVLSLLAALLTVGSLSDYIGRRPAILAALVLNIAAMVMFMTADSAMRADRGARASRASPRGSRPRRSGRRSSTPIEAVDRC